MSFLFPAFLFGAAAAVVPVLLHLLARDRAPRRAFSDIRFLERVFVHRDRRRRLRELALLALRVAALALLAAAFARPYLTSADGGRRTVVVAVDRSASLSAPGRMAEARQRAIEAVSAAPADAAVAVVAFDDAAEVVAPPAVGRALARAAIERLAATPGGTNHAAGLAAAAGLVGAGQGRIVVVGDLQASGWAAGAPAALPASVQVDIVGLPPLHRNLAVTGVEADAAGFAAILRNTGSHPVETAAALSLDGREVARRRVTVPPGDGEVRWDVSPARARSAAVSVEDGAGFRWDDTRHLVLGAAPPTVVRVVVNGGRLDAEAFYLAQALGAAPPSRPIAVRPVTPAALAAPEASDWRAGDVVVILGTDGLGRPGRARVAAFVADGGGLLLAVGPGVDPRLARDLLGESPPLEITPPDAAGPDAAGRRFVPVDPRHPVFARLGAVAATLGRARFTGTARGRLPDADPDDAAARAVGPPQVLARFDHADPALIEYRRGDGRALVFASDLGMVWNDLPRHPGFAPFLQEIVRYLAGRETPPVDLRPADLPAGVPRRPGVAALPASGRLVAVNVDTRESEPHPLTPEEFRDRLRAGPAAPAGEAPATDGAAREQALSLWWYIVLATAFVLIGEAWLARSMA